jgi:hypothetical protein
MGFQAMGKDILSLPDCTAQNMQSDLFCSLHRKSQPKSGWLSVACIYSCLSFPFRCPGLNFIRFPQKN